MYDMPCQPTPTRPIKYPPFIASTCPPFTVKLGMDGYTYAVANPGPRWRKVDSVPRDISRAYVAVNSGGVRRWELRSAAAAASASRSRVSKGAGASKVRKPKHAKTETRSLHRGDCVACFGATRRLTKAAFSRCACRDVKLCGRCAKQMAAHAVYPHPPPRCPTCRRNGYVAVPARELVASYTSDVNTNGENESVSPPRVNGSPSRAPRRKSPDANGNGTRERPILVW